MFNSLLGATGPFGNVGQGLGQAQGQHQYGPNSLAQQAYNNNQQYYQQQAMAAQQAFAQGQYRPFVNKKYMIDGKSMDFEEFVNTLYPDDCAEKTMLILKFKKED